MAGGGSRAGTVYGATDEFGYNVVESPVHVHDLHATLFASAGIHHEQLTFLSSRVAVFVSRIFMANW